MSRIVPTPRLLQRAEPLPRVCDRRLLVPAAEAGPGRLQRLRADEDVLVHENDAELGDVDVAGSGGNGGHDAATSLVDG